MKHPQLLAILSLLPTALLCAAEAVPAPAPPIDNPKPTLKFTPTPAPQADENRLVPQAPPVASVERLQELRRRSLEQMRAMLGNDPAFGDLARQLGNTPPGLPDPVGPADTAMRDALDRINTMRAELERQMKAGTPNTGAASGNDGWQTTTKTLPGGGTMTIRSYTYRSAPGGTTPNAAPKNKPESAPEATPADELPNESNTVVIPAPADKKPGDA